MIEFEIRPTRSNVLAAARHLVLARPVLLTLAIIYCAGSITVDLSDGRLDDLLPAVLAMLLALVFVGGYLIRRQAALAALARTSGAPIQYSLGDDEVRIAYPGIEAALPWSTMRELWIHSDVAMLFYQRNGYITLPMSQLPPAALAHLIAQVRPRGKVRDRRPQRERQP